jgi:hypothetical protein
MRKEILGHLKGGVYINLIELKCFLIAGCKVKFVKVEAETMMKLQNMSFSFLV